LKRSVEPVFLKIVGRAPEVHPYLFGLGVALGDVIIDGIDDGDGDD